MKKSRKRNWHVIPYAGEWAVKREGAKRISKRFSTQRLAIAFARNVARINECEVIIHRADGTIRDSDTYGHEGKAKDRKH